VILTSEFAAERFTNTSATSIQITSCGEGATASSLVDAFSSYLFSEVLVEDPSEESLTGPRMLYESQYRGGVRECHLGTDQSVTLVLTQLSDFRDSYHHVFPLGTASFASVPALYPKCSDRPQPRTIPIHSRAWERDHDDLQ
jgi:hypothetical protein